MNVVVSASSHEQKEACRTKISGLFGAGPCVTAPRPRPQLQVHGFAPMTVLARLDQQARCQCLQLSGMIKRLCKSLEMGKWELFELPHRTIIVIIVSL